MSCRAIEEAVLLTCDVPMIRYIQHIDQERSRETNLDSFVLRKLDDTHLYVRPDVVQMLRGKIKELQVCAPPEHCAPRARHMPTPHACALAAVAQKGLEHIQGHKRGREWAGCRRGRANQQAAGQEAQGDPG